MGNFFRFMFSKSFLKHMTIAVIFLGCIIWGVFKYLEVFTLHKQTITVPDFIGFKTDELDEFIADKQLQYIIMDSVYDLDKPKGTVVDQNPRPFSQVKQNRKIYLTANAKMSPMVSLPELKDITLRQAMAILETYGLKVGNLDYKPDECVNCVLSMIYKGSEIKPGKLVVKGAAIDLVLGKGESTELVSIPYLINLTRDETETLLKSKSLNLGAENYDNCNTSADSIGARVWKQIPAYSSEGFVHLGSSINLFFTNDTAKLPKVIPDSILLQNDQPPDEAPH